MAEGNLRYYLLYDLKKILLGPFAYLPRRQCRSRVSDTEKAQALLDFRGTNDRIDTSGQIFDLFQVGGTDTKDFSHFCFSFSSYPT